MLRRSLRSLALLSLAACASASTGVRDASVQSIALDRPFALHVGQSASLDEVVPGAPFRVTFLGVTNDSRCPQDAQCVWEGDARIALRLEVATNTADTAAHTSSRLTPDPELGGFRVAVEGLSPGTRMNVTIDSLAYVATLRVVRR